MLLFCYLYRQFFLLLLQTTYGQFSFFFIYSLGREIQQQGLLIGYDNFNIVGVFVIGNKTSSKMTKRELFFLIEHVFFLIKFSDWGCILTENDYRLNKENLFGLVRPTNLFWGYPSILSKNHYIINLITVN